MSLSQCDTNIRILVSNPKIGDIVIFLDIEQKCMSGWNPLHLASHKGNDQLVSYLLDVKEVDPNVVTNDLMTALHLAIFGGHVEVVKLLVECTRTDINLMPDLINGTPLHWAATVNNQKMVFLLLLHNSDCSITNNKNKFAKNLSENQEIIDLIVEYEEKQEKAKEELEMLAIEEDSKGEDWEEMNDQYFLASLDPHNPFVLISKSLHNHTQFLNQSIHSIFQSYMDEFINYEAFKIRGFLKTVGAFKINSVTRYCVFSSLDGMLMTYKSTDDYPRQYKSMFPLYMIEEARMQYSNGSSSWYKNKNQYWFDIINVNGGKTTFYSKNELGVETWVTVIQRAIKFRLWLTHVQSLNFEDKEERQIMTDLLTKISKKKESMFSITYEITEETKLFEMHPPLTPVKRREERILSQVSEELDTQEDRVCFDSFKIITLLGEGAFGKVFRVEMKTTNEEYAMKVLKKSFLFENKQLKYAISEWNILKQIKHPFVVSLHYSFQTATNLYMVLDYCNRGDLLNYLDQKARMTEEEARFVLCQIIIAIQHLHSQHIVYRDMKPENILIDSQSNCKLADFGLAKEGVMKNQNATSFWGSPAYLPPELLTNQRSGKEGDYYQIGIILYEMLVGIPPFYSDNMVILYKSIQKGKYDMPTHITQEAWDLIEKLLERKPKKRLSESDIRDHEFFKDINWEYVENKAVPSPLTFDQQVDDLEEPVLKETESTPVNFEDQDYFSSSETLNRVRGFTFKKLASDADA